MAILYYIIRDCHSEHSADITNQYMCKSISSGKVQFLINLNYTYDFPDLCKCYLYEFQLPLELRELSALIYSENYKQKIYIKTFPSIPNDFKNELLKYMLKFTTI